jgi:hypothetical protein
VSKISYYKEKVYMRLKKYIHGLTFFTTVDMFEALKQISDEKQIGMSELLRLVLNEYICQRSQVPGDDNADS